MTTRRLGVGLLVVALALAGLGLLWQGAALRRARTALAQATQAAATARAAPPAPPLVDTRFAQFMVLHHEQALLLAQIVLSGQPGGVTRLAENVRTQQLLELGEMLGWLQLWQVPVVPPDRSMYWMLASGKPLDAETRRYLLACQRAPTGMAGLASDAEVQALRTATGPARDALFLALMRRHHEGGVPMARFAAGAAGLPAVRTLAASIALEQQEEVVAMRMAQAQTEAQARAAAPVRRATAAGRR